MIATDLEWLSEHFSQLINVPGELDKLATDKLLQRPVVTLLDDAFDINEDMSAIFSVQNKK